MYTMFNLALVGVFTGGENGKRSRYRSWTMICMPPIFGSRNSVCVSPSVNSLIFSLADCEPSMPKPIGVLPLASSVDVLRRADDAVIAVDQRLFCSRFRAVDAGPRLHQRDLLVAGDDEVGDIGVGDIAAAAVTEEIRGDEPEVRHRFDDRVDRAGGAGGRAPWNCQPG